MISAIFLLTVLWTKERAFPQISSFVIMYILDILKCYFKKALWTLQLHEKVPFNQWYTSWTWVKNSRNIIGAFKNTTEKKSIFQLWWKVLSQNDTIWLSSRKNCAQVQHLFIIAVSGSLIHIQNLCRFHHPAFKWYMQISRYMQIYVNLVFGRVGASGPTSDGGVGCVK